MGYMEEEASNPQARIWEKKRQVVMPPQFVLSEHSEEIAKDIPSSSPLFKLPSWPIPITGKESETSSRHSPTLKLPSRPIPTTGKESETSSGRSPAFKLPSRPMPTTGKESGTSSGRSPAFKLPSRPMPTTGKENGTSSGRSPALKLPSRPMPTIDTINTVEMPTVLPAHLQKRSATSNLQLVRKEEPAQSSAPTQSNVSETETQARKPKQHAIRRKRRRRVPEMRQMSAVECGAACLAMILNYYGHTTSISEVQERCGVGRDGLSALAIAKAARQYGLRVRSVSVKQEKDFRLVSLPAIAYWECNHFIVVERWSPKHVDVLDPAIGRRRLTSDEFEEGFTGLVIMLEPGPQFEPQSAQPSISLRTYLQSVLQMRGIIAQIIGSSLLLQVFGLGLPLLTEIIIDQIIPIKASNLLLVLGLGALLLLLTQGVTSILRVSLLIYLQTRIDAQIMLNFFEHLLSLPYRFFQLRLNGDILSRMNSNIAIRDLLTSQLISSLLDGSTIAVYLLILIWQSSFIAGLTVAIGALQVGLILITAPIIRRLTLRDLAAQGKTQGYLNEVLSGIATLKAAGAENRAVERWTNLFFDEMNISVRLNYLLSIVGITVQLLQTLAPLLLLWIGAIQVINGTMPLGTMLALNTLAASFLTPLSSLAASGQKIQTAQAHFDRIADVVGTEPEQDAQQVQMPPKLKGNIELENVSFQYDPHTPPVLKDISVKIRPGQKVALVGRTGSGKSTLGKLLIGLITPTQGSVLYDGIPLQKLNYQEVRKQFGVVLQESFLFSGSIRENIAFNNPEMDMNHIVRAARKADINEDIEKLPMKYETLVSEGGSVFSGGQRQRLALARALANRPAILLLDEATSALDVATERTVEQNLNKLSCTQIVIAHRLSTIRHADLILVLHEGRIVEQGTHEFLLRRNRFYAQLIKTQVENGEIEVA
jgi:ATP-binding cassette subfamily B protein